MIDLLFKLNKLFDCHPHNGKWCLLLWDRYVTKAIESRNISSPMDVNFDKPPRANYFYWQMESFLFFLQQKHHSDREKRNNYREAATIHLFICPSCLLSRLEVRKKKQKTRGFLFHKSCFEATFFKLNTLKLPAQIHQHPWGSLNTKSIVSPVKQTPSNFSKKFTAHWKKVSKILSKIHFLLLCFFSWCFLWCFMTNRLSCKSRAQ